MMEAPVMAVAIEGNTQSDLRAMAADDGRSEGSVLSLSTNLCRRALGECSGLPDPAVRLTKLDKQSHA
jgi:hypothetical protein